MPASSTSRPAPLTWPPGAVLAWLAGRAAAVNAAARGLPAAPVGVPDMERLAEQVGAIDRKLAALLLRELDGTPATVHELARAELVARRAELVGRIEAEQERRVLASPAPRQAALDLIDEWDELPVTHRREALRRLIRRVVVHYRPGRVVIEEL